MEMMDAVVPIVIIGIMIIALNASGKKQKSYMELAMKAQEKALKLQEESNKVLIEIRDSLRK